ncbi:MULTISPECIES: DinB family protein [Bacillus]|uniref:Damage-inducible protein DinB n=2 Tax=Bacillus TaxID=1386 RepID=A0A0M5JF79_9BACI|nr:MULTISPECIES: DinB family protein [Bacillus]ALC83377.1 damage-inducible protein DinB [Bacillus gobiensis]MBP1084132.1 putative damage-inducible protein DinB [Bacillus capparidis]MED1095552.1 DinB family protein [Bacillus capparidis]
MKILFEYNWEVRDEWLEWCKKLSPEELMKKRTGGVGSILKTMFHIIDVEISWIYAILEKEDFQPEYNDYQELEKVVEFSKMYRDEMREAVLHILKDPDAHLYIPWWNQTFAKGVILRHVIAHEIHHVGQLSVWAREIGTEPVSATLLNRKCIS